MVKRKIAQSLSVYEVCIIVGIQEGKTLATIASELDLSERSVAYFFHKLSRQLDISSTTELGKIRQL